MDANTKEKVISILTDEIKKRPQRYCLLVQVTHLLQNGGIRTENYFGGAKIKLKTWLAQEFGSNFLVFGDASLEIVVMRDKLTYALVRAREEALIQARRFHREVDDKKWALHMSKVGELLKNNKVAYTLPLKSWFAENCPCFAVDNNYLIPANIAAPVPSRPTLAVTPAEMTQCYSYLYMKRNHYVKALQRCMGTEPPTDFSRAISKQFGLALLGKPQILLDAQDDEVPRMALNSGLSTAQGDVIYCILERKDPSEENGFPYQCWQIVECCYPGEQLENGLGTWLQTRFSLYRTGQAPFFPNLTEQLDDLSALQKSLLPEMERYLQELRSASAPSISLAKPLGKYERAWNILRTSLQSAGIPELAQGMTLDALHSLTDSRSLFSQSLSAALHAFDLLSERTAQIFSALKLAPPYTCSSDSERLHRTYDLADETVPLDDLEQTLTPYEDLRKLLSCSNLTEDSTDLAERIARHFTEFIPRMAPMFLGYPEDAARLEDGLAQVRNALEICKVQLRELGSGLSASPLEPDDLLRVLTAEDDTWGVRWAKYAARALPKAEALQALALNRREDAEKLLGQEGGVDGSPLPQLPEELTYYSAAQRLLQVVGNRDRAAETYLLLGAFSAPGLCIPALLDLYRKQGQEDRFTLLAKRFASIYPLSLENQRFRLSLLCAHTPEQAFGYVQEHFPLFYDPDCLRILIPLAGQYAPAAEASLRERLAKLEGLPQPDEFSGAVIRMDVEAIQSFVEHPELLSPAYSDSEIKHISMEFTGGNYPSGTDAFSTARRLNLFLPNRTWLAEGYLWQTLANGGQPQNEAFSMLLTFMADAGRWEECRRFYDRYAQPISAIRGELGYLCRGMYLLSLIHSFRQEAPGQVQKDLVSALYLLTAARPSVKEMLAGYAAEPGAEDAGFWRELLEQVLPPIASHPPLRTVALLDSYLERTMLPEDALTLHGVDAHQAQRARAVYQRGEFCQDMDAGGTALRVFQLFGGTWDAAQALARFALRSGGEDSRALQVLWGLAGEDQSAQFDLLSRYPSLRAGQPQAYTLYLFQNKKYQEFLEQVSGKPASDPLDPVRRFIAAQGLEPDRRDALPEDLSQLNWVGPLGRRLLEVLVSSGRGGEAEKLLRENFDAWLVELPSELLKDLVQTVGGADRDGLRERAAASGQTSLAVYCCNVLNAQDPDGLCQSYYESSMAAISVLASEQEAKEKLKTLIQLYPQRDGELRESIIPPRICLLVSKGQVVEAAKTVREQVCSPVVLQQLFDVFAGDPAYYAACQGEPLRTALADASIALGVQPRCLQFFHRLAEEAPSKAFSTALLKHDLAALETGGFPVDLLDQAQRQYLGWVDILPANEVLLCLIRLTELAGKQEEREYALACLSSRISEPDAREQIPELSGKQPSVHLAEPLLQVLRQREFEGGKSFFAFCRALAETMPPDNGLDGDDRLAQKLYADPAGAVSWRQWGKLLDEDTEDVTERYLRLATEYSPALYEDYMVFCLEKGQYAPVMPALLSWARSGYASQCLSFVSRRLDAEPGFFQTLIRDSSASGEERVERGEQVDELVCALCDTFSGDNGKLTVDRMGKLIHVAVGVGSKQALEQFLKVFSGAMFAWSGEEVALALICRLLLADRVADASPLLRTLSGYLMENSLPLKKTLCSLAEQDASNGTDTLAQWLHRPSHRLLLNLILPNGNRFNLKSINALILQKTPADLRLDLSRELPALGDPAKDHGLCAAQFILASTAPDAAGPANERVEMLYQCLMSMVNEPPEERSQSYYRRNRAVNAQILAILTATMQNEERAKEVQALCCTAFGTDSRGIAVQDQVKELLALSNQFANQDDQVKELLFHSYLGLVTGNWYEALRSGWRQEQPLPTLPQLQSFSDADAGPAPELARPLVFGLFRSALRILFPLDPVGREHFLDWMRKSVATGPYSEKTINLLEAFSRQHLDELAQTMGGQELARLLECPIEFPTFEQSIYYDIYMPLTRQYPDLQFELTLLFGACGDSDTLTSEIEKGAVDVLFKQGEGAFLAAGQKYRALEQLCSLGRKHIIFRRGGYIQQKPVFYHAFYNARRMLCAVLDGDRHILPLLRNDKLSPDQYINIFIELSNILWNSNSKLTAADCNGLLNALSANGLSLLKALLLFTDMSASDQEKVDFLNTFKNSGMDSAWGVLCYILKYPYAGDVKLPFFLQSLDVARELNNAYLTEPDLGLVFGDRRLTRHLLFIDLRYTNSSSQAQKYFNPEWDNLREAVFSMSDQEADPAEDEPTGFGVEAELASILEALAPCIEDAGLPSLSGDGDPVSLAEGGDLDAYLKDWGILTGKRLLDTLDRRLEASQQLVCAALAGGGTSKSRYICALLYCVNLYDYLRKEKINTSRLQVFKQLMSLPTATLIDPVCSLLVLSVLTGGEVENLFSSHKSIDALLGDKREYTAAYQNISRVLCYFPNHRVEGEYFIDLYQVLDSLGRDLENADTDAARKEWLGTADRTLPSCPTSMLCKAVAGSVKSLITEAVKALSNRPVLQIKVLNPDKKRYPREGILSGVVTNSGGCPAKDIELRLSIDDKFQGRYYTLSKLAAFDGKASFEIPYVFDGEGDQLSWIIEASYTNGSGKSYNDVSASGTLRLLSLGQEPIMPKYAEYDTKTIFFDHATIINGEPIISDFIGRKNETDQLKALIASEHFSGCSNAIVYGIRRVGKTSLLNYFTAYVHANRPDILLVDFNCQLLSSGVPIFWNTFVKPFLDRVESLYKYDDAFDIDEDKWSTFQKDWTTPPERSDLDLEDLPKFFEDLSRITHKGCYLVLDEVDTLFRLLNERDRGIDPLLSALQACNTAASTASAFHYILCGSTWILRSITDGKNTCQIHHGAKLIEIGRLTNRETKELLNSVKWPVITKEAAEAVWKFAGGLAWHTKLIGNAMLKRVYDSGRTTVYPYDVHNVLDSQINLDNFEFLLDGIKKLDKDEDAGDATGDTAFSILVALQSKAVDQSVYVSETELQEMVIQGSSAQGDSFVKALELLKRLKLIEAMEPKRDRYRFCVDIYRRYFRKFNASKKARSSGLTSVSQKEEDPLYFCPVQELQAVSDAAYGDFDDI